MFRKAERVLVELFEGFENDPRQLPTSTQERLRAKQAGYVPGDRLDASGYRVLCDYLAGMTDRYALQEHKRLYDPFERA
jgi:dGTPase